MSSGEITVTLVLSSTGQSESIGVHATRTTLTDLVEWSKALFGINDDGNAVQLMREGQLLHVDTVRTLQQAGIRHGDVVAVRTVMHGGQSATSSAATHPPVAAAPGGLDFSSLLASATPKPASTSTSLLSNNNNNSPPPVSYYYPGMSFDEAMSYNPHPHQMIQLLSTHEHLWKELHYHSPTLAQELKQCMTSTSSSNDHNLQQATRVWREYLVKGGIQAAMKQTETYHVEQRMKERLVEDPNDVKAQEYFGNKESKSLIQQQYQSMMQEYPESMGRVLMLYVHAKVNGHAISAFVDSGAQSTIMSKKCARECGVLQLVDKRFAGVAVGVGKGKILGRIHVVQLQLDNQFFPCSVTVMDDDEGLGDKNMDFLLGLDMLKRFNCTIDLERGVLRFRLGPDEHMETPFLHEKDLDESKGGTRGFDADRANEELMRAMQKRQDGENDEGKPSTK